MRVLVVAGASGGHIYPAVSFLDKLKEKQADMDALLVLPKRNIKNKITAPAYNVKYISVSPIALRFNFKNVLAVFKLLRGSFESLFLLLEFRPDIVVGFGCLDSVPLLFFAWLFRIKTLIHEQNVIPGRANRLLAIFADRIAVSFPETAKFLKDFQKKTVVTGNPVRQELEQVEKKEALDFFGFNENKFTILVMGGSLGSHNINGAFLKAASCIPDKSKLQIIHLTGIKDYELLNKSYKDLDVDSKILDFFNAMHYAYSACDLVISRAGATTITEVMFFKLPAILIPYPYAYQHQLNNAKFLQQKGCAVIIEEEDLDKGRLRETIQVLIDNPARLKGMRSGYEGLPANRASELLVKEVSSLNN